MPSPTRTPGRRRFDLTGSYWITIEDEEVGVPAPVDTFRLRNFGFVSDDTEPTFSCYVTSLDGWGYRLAVDPGELEVDAWTVDWDYQTGDPDPEPEALDSMFLEHYYTIAPASGEEYVVRVKAWRDGAEGLSAIASYEVPVRVEDRLWGINADPVEFDYTDGNLSIEARFNRSIASSSGELTDVCAIVDPNGEGAEDINGNSVTITTIDDTNAPTYLISLSGIPIPGSYYLVFDPSSTVSATGQLPMDQDWDGVPGETTDDVFRVEFAYSR